jgi:hypothetical protein
MWITSKTIDAMHRDGDENAAEPAASSYYDAPHEDHTWSSRGWHRARGTFEGFAVDTVAGDEFLLVTNSQI